jgi:hypothetical protein
MNMQRSVKRLLGLWIAFVLAVAIVVAILELTGFFDH